MKRFLYMIVLLAAQPMTLLAQEYPRAEAFGGYSYFRANPEQFNLHGWNASISGNLTGWFGIVGDFSGHYGAPSVLGFTVPGVNISSTTMMAGPRIMARNRGPVTPFAHFLIGAARADTRAYVISYSEHALAAAVGGGLDVRLSDRIAFRAVQVDYLMTRFHSIEDRIFGWGDRQNNVRLSAGILFRF